MPLSKARRLGSRDPSGGVETTLRRLWRLDLGSHPDVEERVRWLLLDTLACAAAGLDEPEVLQLEATLSHRLPGRVRWPGGRHDLSVTASAAIGAMAACWHESCEGLAIAHGRPGLHSVPVGVALGLAEGATLGAALTAIVVGYELGARAGMAMRIRPGLHVDGTWGLLGATSAAAHLLGLDEERALAALAAAACQIPSSLYLPVSTGNTARNTYASHAVTQGVFLAEAAGAGVTAPIGAFAHAAAHLAARPLVPGTWNWPDTEDFLILQGYLKPFAAVRHTHYGAEAARRWSSRSDHSSANIEKLTLDTYSEALTYCGNRDPQTPIQAQFSLSYAVACVLSGHPLTAKAYSPEVMADREMRRLEALVEVRVTEEFAGRGARLTVQHGGRRDVIEVDQVLGDPGMPFTRTEVRTKADELLRARLGDQGAARLVDAVFGAGLAAPLRSVISDPGIY